MRATVFYTALAAAFLSFVAVACFLTYLRRSHIDLYRRMRHYQDDGAAYNLEQRSPWRRLVDSIAGPLSRLKVVRKLDVKLWQAGLPLSGAEYLAVTSLVTLAVTALVWALSLNLFLSFLSVALLFLAAFVFLSYRIQERQRIFMEQLGDCLVTISNALRAGYSFQQAVEVVAKEMEPPISTEFANVSRELSMGIRLEKALEDMSERMESRDLDLMVTAVLIQREVGGNLALILDSISETIAERIRMKREVMSLTAQGRLSALVLLALPWGMGLVMYIVNQEQTSALFTDNVGRMAVLIAACMELVGYIFIKRIVDIES